MSKSPKQLPYCLKGTEANVVLLICNDVFCEVRTYIVTVALREYVTRKAIS